MGRKEAKEASRFACAGRRPHMRTQGTRPTRTVRVSLRQVSVVLWCVDVAASARPRAKRVFIACVYGVRRAVALLRTEPSIDRRKTRSRRFESTFVRCGFGQCFGEVGLDVVLRGRIHCSLA